MIKIFVNYKLFAKNVLKGVTQLAKSGEIVETLGSTQVMQE